ncbi:MAG: hypothetical protein ACLTBV_24410 [Enterocloster bolteae]
MMTFFDKEENVDTECTRRMVEFMLEHGADGFYLYRQHRRVLYHDHGGAESGGGYGH